MPVVATVAVSATSVVFAVAFVTKLRPGGLTALVASVGQLWPWGRPPRAPARRLVAMTVVTVEGVLAAAAAIAVLAVLLDVPARALVLAALLGASALLGGFTLLQGLAVARGVRAPCSCFGRSGRPVGRVGVARTALMTATAAVGLAAALPAGSTPGPAGALLATVVGVLLGTVLVSMEDLADVLVTSPRSADTVPRGGG